MNACIVTKNLCSVKYLKIIICCLLIAGLCDLPGKSHEKNWEYTEITGTIRRVRQSYRSKWNLVKRVIAGLCGWLWKATLVVGASCWLGLFGPWLLWLETFLGIGKGLAGLAVMCTQRPVFRKLLMRAVVYIGWIALAGAGFLSLATPVEACLWAEPTGSVVATQAVAALASHRMLQAPLPQVINEARYKIAIEDQVLLYQTLCEQVQLTSPQVLSMFSHIQISVGQLNRIRKNWDLSRRQGRPRKDSGDQAPIATPALRCLPNTGAHLFSLWLEQSPEGQRVVQAIYDHVQSYSQQHPAEDFRLVHSSQKTIAKKWLALVMLPLLGVEKITELDYRQHDLARVLGYSYSSATLTQFLGDLERVTLDASLKPLLALEAQGQFCYIDGHMIAFWTRLKMHKGHITMLGRIMPGSKAVIAHDQSGQAVGFDYYPPDTHLTHIVERYCNSMAALTGIRRFVIDREVNSVNMARLFVRCRWGLICLLDANEYKGLQSFKRKFAGRLEDGTVLYKAAWKMPRPDDPRSFVIAFEPQRCLVYWCTPDIALAFSARQIVTTYRQRAEIQENSFKRMIAHGALNTNYGIKKIWGIDRTHQRALNVLEEKAHRIEAKKSKAQDLIRGQVCKIHDSLEKQQSKLLRKRTAKLDRLLEHRDRLVHNIKEIAAQKEKLGQPGLRSDRDFRKQAIMTFRTLWLENMLQKFNALLADTLNPHIDTEVLLHLFFLRRGVVAETDQEISYSIASDSLSPKYRCLLQRLIDGFQRISLTHRGKKVFLKFVGFT